MIAWWQLDRGVEYELAIRYVRTETVCVGKLEACIEGVTYT